MLSRLFLGFMLLLVPAIAQALPPIVYVVRHLHTPEGPRDPDLTEQGRAVAATLPAWFKGKPLTAIYLSEYRRMRQTAGPLAAERRLVPKVYDPTDTPAYVALIARIRAETGPVLVVGHSNTVPGLVEALGGTRPAPMTHPDFGDIWTIRMAGPNPGSTRAMLPGAK